MIIKSTGEPTYRLPDIAYHCEKFRRGYDLMIDIFGADHVATYPDVLAALKALGYDSAKVKVLIHQFVTVMQGTEVVKMSTRKANFITLDELIADAGMRCGPVLLHHAHGLEPSEFRHRTREAEIRRESGVLRAVRPCAHLEHPAVRGEGRAAVLAGAPANFDLLAAPEELALIKQLLQFPEIVESCAMTHEPHRLADYLHDVAAMFHVFYHHHRVVTPDEGLTAARLALVQAVQIVLRNGFTILGISAPEQM